MIEIIITKTTTVNMEKTQSMLTRKTPTDKVQETEPNYGGEKKHTVLFDETYELVKIPFTQESQQTLLKQQISDESFDFLRVIAAINGLTR
jgi:hypothetical protein